MVRLEKLLPYEDVVFFRSIAQLHMKQQSPSSSTSAQLAEATANVKKGAATLFKKFKDATSQPKSVNEHKPHELGPLVTQTNTSSETKLPAFQAPASPIRSLTPELRLELSQVLGYQPDSKTVKQTTFRIDFILHNGRLSLSRDSKELTVLSLRDASVSFHQLDAQWKMQFQLNALHLADMSIAQSSPFFNVISFVKQEPAQNQIVEPAIYVSFSRGLKPNSGNEQRDYLLKGKITRSEITIRNNFVKQLISFFSNPSSLHTSFSKDINRWLTKTTAAQLRLAIANRTSIETTFDVSAPLIVVPTGDSEDAALIVVDLGHLAVQVFLFITKL